MNHGQIAAIVIGSLLGICFLIFAIIAVLLYRFPKFKKKISDKSGYLLCKAIGPEFAKSFLGEDAVAVKEFEKDQLMPDIETYCDLADKSEERQDIEADQDYVDKKKKYLSKLLKARNDIRTNNAHKKFNTNGSRKPSNSFFGGGFGNFFGGGFGNLFSDFEGEKGEGVDKFDKLFNKIVRERKLDEKYGCDTDSKLGDKLSDLKSHNPDAGQKVEYSEDILKYFTQLARSKPGVFRSMVEGGMYSEYSEEVQKILKDWAGLLEQKRELEVQIEEMSLARDCGDIDTKDNGYNLENKVKSLLNNRDALLKKEREIRSELRKLLIIDQVDKKESMCDFNSSVEFSFPEEGKTPLPKQAHDLCLWCDALDLNHMRKSLDALNKNLQRNGDILRKRNPIVAVGSRDLTVPDRDQKCSMNELYNFKFRDIDNSVDVMKCPGVKRSFNNLIRAFVMYKKYAEKGNILLKELQDAAFADGDVAGDSYGEQNVALLKQATQIVHGISGDCMKAYLKAYMDLLTSVGIVANFITDENLYFNKDKVMRRGAYNKKITNAQIFKLKSERSRGELVDILMCSDAVGEYLMDECRSQGVALPEEVGELIHYKKGFEKLVKAHASDDYKQELIDHGKSCAAVEKSLFRDFTDGNTHDLRGDVRDFIKGNSNKIPEANAVPTNLSGAGFDQDKSKGRQSQGI